MALPCTSVIVIIVLLNVAFTRATPELMSLRSRRRPRVASLPILDPSPGSARASPVQQMSALLLLPGDRPRRTLARARVCVGPLSAHRQAAAMTQAAIAPEVHQ